MSGERKDTQESISKAVARVLVDTDLSTAEKMAFLVWLRDFAALRIAELALEELCG